MKQGLAALCLLLVLAMPCLSVFAQSLQAQPCHICIHCQEMQQVSTPPCCERQPTPSIPPKAESIQPDLSFEAELLLPALRTLAFAPTDAEQADTSHPLRRPTVLRI